MIEFKFSCPHCGRHIQADVSYVGRQVGCPSCQQYIVVPPPGKSAPPLAAQPRTSARMPYAPPEAPAGRSPEGRPKSILALLSLILSVLGLSVPAIICGHIARSDIKKTPLLAGKGLALAGLIIGYLGLTAETTFLAAHVMSQSGKDGAFLFHDRLDSDTSADWNINTSGPDNRVTFAFDYSTMSIPKWPGARNTKALKLEANLSLNTLAAVSLSPKNKEFSGDYQLRFYAWQNTAGPMPICVKESSQAVTAGIGVDSHRILWVGPGGVTTGVWCESMGDGQSGLSAARYPDYGIYVGPNFQTTNSGVYAAGRVYGANDRTAFISQLDGHAPPDGQQRQYPMQTGRLADGAFGFAWREVILRKCGNTVTWTIDGVPIATIANPPLGASISVGYLDPFPGSMTAAPNTLLFGLIADVKVEALKQ